MPRPHHFRGAAGAVNGYITYMTLIWYYCLRSKRDPDIETTRRPTELVQYARHFIEYNNNPNRAQESRTESEA
jgi:hypothetical protein